MLSAAAVAVVVVTVVVAAVVAEAEIAKTTNKERTVGRIQDIRVKSLFTAMIMITTLGST